MKELSPAASFINDMSRAFGVGQSRGLSIKKMEEMARDFADDLADLIKEEIRQDGQCND